MQSDVFVTKQKGKAAEQTNVTQTEKEKKEPVFVLHAKRGRKYLWQVSLARISGPYRDQLYQAKFLHCS